jgi:ubiquitin carboxyl-terminal hydrolase 25
LLVYIVVSLLANLFWEMEYTEHPAITPALELAKLALVTSKDEEEDAALAADQHTDSSNDTDATLVEDRAASAGAGAGAAATTTTTGPASPGSPGSVLGKRGRVQGREEEAEYVIVSKPPSPVAESSMAAIVPPVASGSGTTVSPEEDVLMRDVADVAAVEEEEKRPVPKRKVTQAGESTMMFGEWQSPGRG